MRSRSTVIVLIALVVASMLFGALPVGGSVQGTGDDARLLASEAGAGAAFAPDMMLYLRVQGFDPLEAVLSLPPELLTQRADGLYLVQLVGPSTPSWTEAIDRLGGELLGYVPDNAYIARLPPSARLALPDLEMVRWVGPYHPGLRVDPSLWYATGPTVDIIVSCLGEPLAVAGEIARLGGQVLEVGTFTVQGTVPRVSLLSLARHADVCWVEAMMDPQFFNDNSARLVSARQGDDGPYDPSPSNRRLWSWNPSTLSFEGTTGAGYIVSVADTGLDDDHPNLAGHLPTKNYLGGSTTQDTYGHGTHCAGTAAGTGTPMAVDSGLPVGKYIGVAPEAVIFMQDIFEGFSFYMNFDVIGRDASASGAVVNSNSWGEYRGGAYGAYEQMYDSMTLDAQPGVAGAQPITFCFSAGNAGPGARSIGSPAASKNVIAVGATGNDKQGTSGNSMAGFSSRGPCADGRIRPDVVTPGVSVVSSAAHPAQIPFNPPPDGGQSWTYMSGTSMSCPNAAGCVALVNDHVEHAWGYDDPSPAIVKALLINGADRLTVGTTYPDNSQGWGRINLTTLKDTPHYRTFFFDEEVGLSVGGQSVDRHIFFVNTSNTFKVTLVWSDYPGTPSASKALVSDLDLVITDPDGIVYNGNNFDSSARSITGGQNDSVNNVEKFWLTLPKVGYWSIEVRATNTPQGPQRFALVAVGDLYDRWVDVSAANVTVSNLAPEEGELVRFTGEVLFTGTQGIGLSSYKVLLRNLNTSEETVFEQGQIPSMSPGDKRPFDHSWTCTRGYWEYVVEITYTGEPSEFSKANNMVRIPSFVKGYGLVAELSSPTVTVWPGRETLLDLRVLNMGNVRDTFALVTEGVPVAWVGALAAPDVTLAPDRQVSIGLSVIPPLASKAGETYTLSTLVVSEGNSTYRQRLPFTVSVGHVYGLMSDLTVEGVSVFPGKVSVHRFNVTNTGNGLDMFSMNATGLPPGWTAELSDDQLELEDNATRSVTVEVQAPEEALMNELATVDIVVRSLGGAMTEMTARTRVRQVRDMDLQVSAEAEVLPGERLPYSILLKNLGNGIDVFRYVETLPRGWNSDFPEDELVLDAYEAYNRTDGTIYCPRTALAGDYTLSFQSELFDQVIERTVVVHVKEVYTVRALIIAGASAMYPGNETTYVVEAYNLGNLPIDVGFELRGTPGAWQLDYSTRDQTIGVNQKAQYTVTVRVPKETMSGFHTPSYALTYGDGEELTEEMTLYIVELPADVQPDGDDGQVLTVGMVLGAILVIVVVVVLAVALVLMRRRKATPLELAIEAGEVYEEEPPQAAPPPRRPPPLPPDSPRGASPPIAQPRTTEELLHGTNAMHREAQYQDRYSRDKAYASGTVLAHAPQPMYAGDCQFCGGRVLEHSSGSLICEKCGAQYTE